MPWLLDLQLKRNYVDYEYNKAGRICRDDQFQLERTNVYYEEADSTCRGDLNFSWSDTNVYYNDAGISGHYMPRCLELHLERTNVYCNEADSTCRSDLT